MTDEKSTALAVSAGTALLGNLEEKTRAFQQMGAAAAMGLYPSGYDTPNKVISAAWMADALGVHPGAFMAGVWPATMGGKIVLMPQWEFENGLLKSRLPGYKMIVHQNDEKAADIEMRDASGDVQRVKFTIERAREMKLTEKPGWMTNVVDHLFAKAFHRCADRIGSHVLGGLPAMALAGDYVPEIVTAPKSDSGAEVVEVATPSSDPRSLLDPEIKRVYGAKQPVSVRLAKMAMILADAMREEFPEGASVPTFSFKSLGEIGPVDAERILRYIEKKWPVGADPAKSEAVPAREEAAPETHPATSTAVVEEEAPPVEEPYVEPPAQRNGDVDWTEFVSLVAQAKRDGRNFIKEAPPKSGRWHFVDKPILDARGATASVLLFKDGAIVEPLGWYADRLRELLPKELR